MQIGIMARTFVRPTLEEVLDAVASHDIHCIQFSFTCAGLQEMPVDIEPEISDYIRSEMQKRDIVMGAVSGTFNMIDPNVGKRYDGLQRLETLAAACERLGTSVITLCTGTRDPESMWKWHPENDTPEAWDDLVKVMTKAVKYAEKYKVNMAFEPEVSNVVDSASKARRLINQIKSPYLKVVMDPANIFHKGELVRMNEMIDEAFVLLGDYIALAHAKDLDHDGEAGHLAAGKGLLDYKQYLSWLKNYDPDLPLILHGLSEDEVDDCVDFLKVHG
ncbi:TIM barrel protein [Candidatus Poribacteria bacterium]|nr:TIM barrel protein [Candidatus Poribacteria bacterium]